MGWLNGFSNRLKLKIDNTKIDETLLDFPVLIKVSNNSGISSLDVSSVFTKIGSDANRKKIAVTTLNGTTQCYVEIERFDYSNNEAWLWVKVPSVSSGSETVFYFYYSSSQSDNTTYVGDTTETPAQNVWDSNFKLVMHIAQDPNGDVADAIKDSTSNANHGTPGGSMTSADLIDGKIGKAIDFDGNDYIGMGNNIDITTSSITLEAIVKTSASVTQVLFQKANNISVTDPGYSCYLRTSNPYVRMVVCDGSNYAHQAVSPTNVQDGVDHYVVGKWDIATHTVSSYVDTSLEGSTTNTNVGSLTNSSNSEIGRNYANGSPSSYTTGIIEEIRISNTTRSAAWIKATYYSNWDELVSFELPLNPDDWSNRLKLTIPADSTDSSLTDFPVMINLSSSSGKTGFDSTAIFNALGDDHQKRFAITKNDGETQCQIELEYWNATEEKAILWTKVPTVYSSVDTDLYFYWDTTVSGNTAYVGDTGDTPAQNVWDSNFKLVMHMAQDPNGDVADAIKDSTSNVNHGTPGGGMTSADLVDGKIGKAIDFDGADDFIDIGDHSSLDIVGDISLELILKSTVAQDNSGKQPCGKYNYSLNFDHAAADFKGAISLLDNTAAWINSDGPVAISDGVYHYIVGKYDNVDIKFYLNGIESTSRAVAGKTIGVNNFSFFIGANSNNAGIAASFQTGVIGEVRISSADRSADWIKATYYSNWDDLIVFQQEDITTTWLSDWSKRIKLTIDKDKIDSTLVDFPINITLASGTNAAGVFSELSTVSGTKKIAVTTNDGTTQCPVEIEKWDWSEKEAILWTKVSSVDSNEDTILYLYYDSSKSDNTTYVGDTGDTPAQNVWDSNFKLVMHMAQDPNGGVANEIKDSTSGIHDGTKVSANAPNEVDGKIGKGQNFDANDEKVTIADHADFDFVAAFTLEVIAKPTVVDTDSRLIYRYDSISTDGYYIAQYLSKWNCAVFVGGSAVSVNSNSSPTLNFEYIVARRDLSGNWKQFIDGLVQTDTSVLSGAIDSTGNLLLGIDLVDACEFIGILDEVRISNTARSSAWIKATYYSNWDGLVSFGSEQEIPTHYYYGYVTEDEVPVSRTIRLYYRNTGALMSATTSNETTGYYYLTTTISGEHYIVTIDDAIGMDYNALILDKLLPRGIE